MNSSSRREGEQKSFPGCDLPCFFHRLGGSPSKQHGLKEKHIRVKRRRTRRERNSVRFGHSATDQAPELRPGCPVLPKTLPPFWGSQLRRCAQSTPIRGACGAQPVIITHNRLTQQHLGMFNREVKSADIERLLSPRTEHDTMMEVTPVCPDNCVEKEEQPQPHKSCEADDHRSLPSELFTCTGEDLSGANKGDSPNVIPDSVKQPHCISAAEAPEAGSQPLVAPTVLESRPEATKTEASQSNTSVVSNEKENVPPPLLAGGSEPARGWSLVKELAQDPQRLLDLKAMFPGRNLTSETRQAVFSALQKQKKPIPNLSALAPLRKLASDCSSGAVHADFRSPINRDQEELELESKSSSGSIRNSDCCVSLKKRKGQEKFIPTRFSLSSVQHTAVREVEESLWPRESFASCVEPDGIDQRGFCLTTAHPHPPFWSVSSQHQNSSRHSLDPEEECPLWKKALLRMAPHWEPSGRQERPEGVTKRALARKQAPQMYCLPFFSRDSWGPSSFSKNSSSADLTEPQQYASLFELSPDVWRIHGGEPFPAHDRRPAHELHSSQLLELGLRNTERAPTDSQTSFDVLKSIWSPKLPRKGTKPPGPQPLASPCLAHQRPSSREWSMEQRQQEEFFQLYGIVPEQHRTFYGQDPQQEVAVPSRPPQYGNDLFSVLPKPKRYCQKVSVEHGRPSENYPVWGLAEAPERIQGTREHSSSSRCQNPAGDLDWMIQLEGAQQLHLFQQLPMSCFPNSEALGETGKPPLCVLQRPLLGPASPEPWAFPRMKLY